MNDIIFQMLRDGMFVGFMYNSEEDGMFLMELKCPGAIPLWLTKVLSEEHIYKTSFSKYGRAYCGFM